MNRKATAFSMSVVLGIGFLAFSRSIGWALNKGFSFTLLGYYTDSPLIKGIVLAMEGLIGMIVPPLIGWYSDRIFTRAGRRKPFILVGGILAGVSIYLVYFFYSLNLPLLAFAFMLSFFYFSMHLYTAQFRALMPEFVESGHRGRASGIITMMEVIGNLVGFILGAILWVMNRQYPFIMGAVMIPLAAILTYSIIDEKELEEEKLRKVKSEGLIQYAKRMFGEKDTLRFYAAQTLWWMGYEFIAIFFMGLMAQIILGTATQENIDKITPTGVLLMGLFNIAAVFSAIVGGRIYDKVSKKKAIITGALIFAVSIFVSMFIPIFSEFTGVSKLILIAFILSIAGAGWGILLSASYPVIGDLLTKYKREEFNGRYYGLFEASRSLPIFLGAILGGAFSTAASESVHAIDYTILFPIAALTVVLALPFIYRMEKLEG